MNRSAIVRIFAILIIIGGIAAGAVFFGMKYMGKDISLPGIGKTETVAQQGDTEKALKMPSLAGTEKFRAVTAKAADGVVLSPIMFSKASGGYETVGDMPFGMSANIRHETVAMKKETLEASKKNPSKFEVMLGSSDKISAPELPQIIEGNVFYSHSEGIIPLDLVVMWPDPSVKNTEKWQSAFTGAGFKEISTEEISNDGKKSKTVKVYGKDGSDARGEVMVDRDIAKKTEVIGYAALFVTSPADAVVRNFLDETTDNLIKDLTKKPLTSAKLKWRQPVAVPEYRRAGSGDSFSLTTMNFSDRYFPGTSEPIVQSSCELWNSVPIGYSWVMQKKGWDKVKEQFIQSVLGKAATDDELFGGVASPENILLRVSRAAETGPGAEVVRIDLIDKKTDNSIAVVFDNFGMVNVQGLRDGVK